MSPINALGVRFSQGTQYITDLRKATPTGFRGRPIVRNTPCPQSCQACKDVCPTRAIQLDPVTLDLGRCVFCSECVDACPEEKFEFTSDPNMGTSAREHLIVREGESEQIHANASKSFSKLFARSLKLRQVSSGGCNGCELELNALSNVNFDLQRFGIEWVASPRHADALVLSGPLTSNMRDAVRLAWDAVPDPRFIVSVGACALSGGLYEEANGVDRSFLDTVGPSLFVPGCPPHPLTFVNAILAFLGIE